VNLNAANGVLADTDIPVTSSEYAAKLMQNNASASVLAQANQLHSGLIVFLLE
jgi:flagellin-like hook-associated protein FlgL